MRSLSFTALSRLILLAPADTARGGDPGGAVLEIVTFRLRAGVAEADFLQAAHQTRSALAGQPGFVRRHLLREPSGQWTDVVEWESLAMAETAAAVMLQEPGFGPFLSVIDAATIGMSHRAVIWQMD